MNFKFVKKGEPGYIAFQKKYTVVRTIVYFGISIAIFLAGYLTTKSRLNLLTVVAVLGCLPASKSLVNAIMFYRSSGCSEVLIPEIRTKAGALPILFDLFLTSYDKNYQISCLTVKGHNIVGFTESARTDVALAEKHIQECLKTGGFPGYTVKLFDSVQKFTNRIEQMAESLEEESIDRSEVLEMFCSISL